MRSTPTLGFNEPSCLEPRSWLYRMLSTRAACESPAHSDRSDSVLLWLAQAANRFSNVKMLDMTDAICPRGICSAERDDAIVFRDSQHLTATFAASLLPALRQRLALRAEDGSTNPGQTNPRALTSAAARAIDR